MDKTYNQYNLLTKAGKEELRQKAKKIRYNPIALNNMLVQQLEHTRQSLGLTQAYFSELLGVTRDFYCKMVKAEPLRYVHVDTLITYCKLFGYDIADILDEAVLNSSDSALRETAMYLSRLSGDTLSALAKTIADSSEDEQTKQQGIVLLTHLASKDATEEDNPSGSTPTQ